MKIFRTIAQLPLWIWIIIYGGFMYMQYASWKTDSLDPLEQEIQTQKAAVSTLQKQNRAAETFSQEREARFQELQSKAAEYQAAIEKLPRNADIPGVLTALADVSDKVGAELTSFQPGKAEAKDFLIETPFKVELRGSFLQIMSFLDEIAHLKRIIASTSISLKDPVLKGRDSILRADATIVTYYFDENARGANVPTDDNKKGATFPAKLPVTPPPPAKIAPPAPPEPAPGSLNPPEAPSPDKAAPSKGGNSS